MIYGATVNFDESPCRDTNLILLDASVVENQNQARKFKQTFFI